MIEGGHIGCCPSGDMEGLIMLITSVFGLIVYLSLPAPRHLTWDNLEGSDGLIRPRLLTGAAG